MALSAKKPKEKPPTLHVALRQQQQQFINYLLEILSCFNKLQYLTILKLLGWCGVIHSGSLNKHRVSQNAFTLRCKVKQWIFAPLHFTESTPPQTCQLPFHYPNKGMHQKNVLHVWNKIAHRAGTLLVIIIITYNVNNYHNTAIPLS